MSWGFDIAEAAGGVYIVVLAALMLRRAFPQKAPPPPKHAHSWARWTEPAETRVWGEDQRPGTSLPIRRYYTQTRECEECGLVERQRVTAEGHLL